jgi:hypothetical protein
VHRQAICQHGWNCNRSLLRFEQLKISKMTFLKRTFSLFMVILSGVQVHAQIASFNFSAGASVTSGWTNVAGDPSTAVRTATDPSGISISSVSTANWSPTSGGICAYNGNGGYPGVYFPPGVTVCDWIQYNGSGYNLALYNALVPQLVLSGLNKDSSYIIRMSGSDILNSGPTQYTVAGASVSGSQSLNNYKNTTQGVTFQHVHPDSTGKIKVYVNCTSTGGYAFLCGLQVFSGSANVGVPVVELTAPGNGSRLAEGGNFLISATASETGGTIAKVEFFADTTKIGEADSVPYKMTWVDPPPGNYQLTAKATDAVGTISTSSVNVAIESLNYFWSTTGNIATGADTSFIGTVDSNRLAIRTNNIERVSVLVDGSVGVGTLSTHGYKLAVNGSGIFTKVSIRNYASWPDYVFKKDYKLPGLDSLERYIRLNQHLPGMISADQAKDQGIDLGDNQALVLQKVEELTLYLIKEHKQVEELTKEVNRLKARLNAKTAKASH